MPYSVTVGDQYTNWISVGDIVTPLYAKGYYIVTRIERQFITQDEVDSAQFRLSHGYQIYIEGLFQDSPVVVGEQKYALVFYKKIASTTGLICRGKKEWAMFANNSVNKETEIKAVYGRFKVLHDMIEAQNADLASKGFVKPSVPIA